MKRLQQFGFRQLKEWRRAYFLRFIYGHKQQDCTACNGSGRYDNDDAPICGGCQGTGLETYPGPKALQGIHQQPHIPFSPHKANLHH